MKRERTAERSAVQLLEEAMGLLRAAPLSTHSLYLAGTLPFAIGILYFVGEMTRSAFAEERLVPASLALAVLFIWKNSWQAAYDAELHAQISGERPPWSGQRIARMVALQSAVQPSSLVVLPLAFLAAVPFAWILAFYRNATLFAGLGARDPIPESARLARLWSRQIWLAISILSLAGLLLFVNYLITVALLPSLAQTFLGIEGSLTRLGEKILNLTTVLVVCVLVYVTLDPVFDAMFVLRVFYGDSVATGRDLRAWLRRFAAAAALVLLLSAAVPFARAQHDRAPAAAVQPVDPVKLDRAIDETLRRREFAWRMPREGPDRESRWVSFLQASMDIASRVWVSIVEFLRGLFRRVPGQGPGEGGVLSRTTMQLMLWGLAALLAIALFLYFFRRRKPATQAVPVTAAAQVDLTDDSVTADQLPESGWLALAEEWIRKNDFRLALRALYLAGLNYLSARSLVSIQRWKSGLDYRRELERRARATPAVVPVFVQNLSVFERGWYGRHEVDQATVRAFAASLEEMRRYAQGE